MLLIGLMLRGGYLVYFVLFLRTFCAFFEDCGGPELRRGQADPGRPA